MLALPPRLIEKKYYRIDPETQMLDPDPSLLPKSEWGVVHPKYIFGIRQKLKLFSLLLSEWNLTKAASAVGTTLETIHNHRLSDPMFDNVLIEIHERHVEDIDTVRHSIAKSGRFGALDRMATLNAFRREIYNPTQQIEITHARPEEVEGRFDKTLQAVDAEIVEIVKTRKVEVRRIEASQDHRLKRIQAGLPVNRSKHRLEMPHRGHTPPVNPVPEDVDHDGGGKPRPSRSTSSTQL